MWRVGGSLRTWCTRTRTQRKQKPDRDALREVVKATRIAVHVPGATESSRGTEVVVGGTAWRGVIMKRCARFTVVLAAWALGCGAEPMAGEGPGTEADVVS